MEEDQWFVWQLPLILLYCNICISVRIFEHASQSNELCRRWVGDPQMIRLLEEVKVFSRRIDRRLASWVIMSALSSFHHDVQTPNNLSPLRMHFADLFIKTKATNAWLWKAFDVPVVSTRHVSMPSKFDRPAQLFGRTISIGRCADSRSPA